MPQYFGTIEFGGGETAQAMMCVDSDRPSEAMVHWYGGNPESGAALVQINRSGNGLIELVPLQLYRSNPNPNARGGLWVPLLPKEEYERFASNRVHLRESRSKLSGTWIDPASKQKRKVIFTRKNNYPKLDAAKCDGWNDFKNWATATRNRGEGSASWFRGHSDNRYSLSTSLHRMGRTRLERYCDEILPRFRLEAEAILDQRINPNDGDDYAMMLGLAQHHGLPTPLLDWTRSAYVAAFFAFSDAIEKSGSQGGATHVRVYGLSQKLVISLAAPVITVPFINPYVCSLGVAPRRNPRLLAQQGEFLVTNIADIEGYLCAETAPETLVAADIPVACASEALEDLAFMGLSAATMFPGLDGLCRNLKHQMLFKRSTTSSPSKAGASHSS